VNDMMKNMNDKTGAETVFSRAYLASFPERTARAGAALAGGLVYEASEVVLPYLASPRVKRPIHHIRTTLWRVPQGNAAGGASGSAVGGCARHNPRSARLPDGERRLVLGIVRQFRDQKAAPNG
jgi:hypothetical protein